jgi:hypothetical protein
MEWNLRRNKLPTKVDAYDVTLEDSYGARMINVAIFRPENSTWEIITDKHNYIDCKVVAWRPRLEPYQGKV